MTGPVVPRAFGVLLLVLTGALVANSAVGPLGLDVVDYPISGTVWNQLVGLELVTEKAGAPRVLPDRVAVRLDLRPEPDGGLRGVVGLPEEVWAPASARCATVRTPPFSRSRRRRTRSTCSSSTCWDPSTATTASWSSGSSRSSLSRPA